MSSWSYSNITTAKACFKKYEHSVINKLPSGEDSVDLCFGTSVHSGLNAYLSGDDGVAIFEAVWNSYNNLDYKHQRYSYEELLFLGKEFMLKFRERHLHNYVPFCSEKRLYGEYKGMKLEGTPDFVGMYKGVPSLRDFKTASYNYPNEKPLTSLQLNVYSYLCMQQLNYTPGSIGFDVFNKSTGSIQNMSLPFDKTHMERMLDDMLTYAEMADKMTSFPMNTESCFYGKRVCSFYDKCFPKKETTCETLTT